MFPAVQNYPNIKPNPFIVEYTMLQFYFVCGEYTRKSSSIGIYSARLYTKLTKYFNNVTISALLLPYCEATCSKMKTLV